jgi:hypothetical protein
MMRKSRAGSIALGAGALAAVLAVAGCGDKTADGAGTAADQHSSTPASSGASSGAAPTTGSSAPASGPGAAGSSASATPPPATSPGADQPSRSTGSGPDHPTKNQGDPRCHTAGLSARITPQDAAAGNRYATLVLTNTTGQACRIYGYGGVQLIGSSAVPSAQHRDAGTPPELLSLPAGGHAYSTLHWGAVPGTGDSQSGQCEPEASTLLVTPPDETTSLRVPWTFGPVCERGAIDQTAYRVGTGPSPAGG